jgi:hypothetical protein
VAAWLAMRVTVCDAAHVAVFAISVTVFVLLYVCVCVCAAVCGTASALLTHAAAVSAAAVVFSLRSLSYQACVCHACQWLSSRHHLRDRHCRWLVE